ncbi:MAG: adenylate/guanylate cyclase domain-containing protein [Acidimicrobiales bacterium]
MTADQADDRAAALARVREVLVQAGASDEAIARAVDDDVLDLLAVDLLIVPARHQYTPREVSEMTMLPLDVLQRLWRALGFRVPADDERALTDLDIQAVRLLQGLLQLGVTDLDTALQLARVIGSSMARIAEAGLLRGAETLGASEDSVRAADAFVSVAEETLPSMAELLTFTWRRHMQAVARRTVLLRTAAREEGTGPVLAVGFADMVGFTLLSQHLRDDELATVVRRFEEISYDTVTSFGGRVVKTIGDEVMFVVDDPVAAAHIGVSLADAYADDDLLSDVRVGLASGPVLVRDGDYFGATVNLASRIVGIAEPGTVLVSDDLHERLARDAAGDLAGKPLRPRMLKDVGRVQLWTCRRATVEADDGADGARRDLRRARRERFGRVVRDLDDLRAAGERFLASSRRDARGHGGARRSPSDGGA